MNASVAPVGDSPLALMRLVLRFNLHPQASLHPSWLPADWPVSTRARLARLAPEAQALLRDALVRAGVLPAEPDHAFDSPVKRLLLLDAPALRRLAFYASLCVHAPLMRPRRDALAAALRRQARRLDDDAVDFVLERAPQATELQMSAHALREHTGACGRVLVDRGHRLLLALLADEGEAAAARLARMLPRRAASLPVPALAARQKQQLRELVLACIVPERLAQWDWLF
ncbi:MAG: type III secretion system protein [Burkholderiaceae bacterium]